MPEKSIGSACKIKTTPTLFEPTIRLGADAAEGATWRFYAVVEDRERGGKDGLQKVVDQPISASIKPAPITVTQSTFTCSCCRAGNSGMPRVKGFYTEILNRNGEVIASAQSPSSMVKLIAEKPEPRLTKNLMFYAGPLGGVGAVNLSEKQNRGTAWLPGGVLQFKATTGEVVQLHLVELGEKTASYAWRVKDAGGKITEGTGAVSEGGNRTVVAGKFMVDWSRGTKPDKSWLFIQDALEPEAKPAEAFTSTL